VSILWVRIEPDSGGGKTDVSSAGKNTTYHKKLIVLTDDYNDGPLTIAAHSDFPKPFEVYSAGSDYDADAVATGVTWARDKKQPKLWRARVTYTVMPGIDTTGGGGADITSYSPSVRTWKIPYEEVVWMARRQLVGTTWTAPAETFTVAMARARELVRNSVNEMFATGIATLKHALAVELGFYSWNYSLTQADAYEDVVNSDTFWGFSPGTVKMVSISGASTSVQNSVVYRVSYEFHIRSDGWGEPIADHGYNQHTATGSVPTGVRAVLDNLGRTKATPSLLDGAGYAAGGVSAPIAVGGTPYLVKWHHLEAAPFLTLGLPTRASLAIT